jgi:hypothetical protein
MTDKTAVRDLIETCGRVAVFMGIVAYALGMIIVNGYLSVVGFHALGLARPEYLMAGGLYIVLVSLGSGTVMLILRAHRQPRQQKSRAERLFIRLFSMVLPLGIFVFLVSMATHGDQFTSVTTVLFISICTVTAARLLYKEYIRLSSAHEIDRVLYISLLVMIAVVVQVILLAIYSFAAYRQLRRAFGGGYAPLVRLDIKEDRRTIVQLVRESPVPPKTRTILAKFFNKPESTYHSLPSESNRSIPLRILADTGDMYVLYIEERHFVRTLGITKDSVTAIIPELESP